MKAFHDNLTKCYEHEDPRHPVIGIDGTRNTTNVKN
jgi:hypothetical protein